MSTHRTHIVFPAELVAQIDAEVGPRKRSAFLVELAETELRRRKLLALLEEFRKDPVVKDEDHPEFAEGTGEWVRKLRAESEHRLADAEAAWNAE